MKPIYRAALLSLASVALTAGAYAQETQSKLTKQMGITQNLGAYLPKDVTFRDESGKEVKFGEMFQGRPVVLVPIFFSCKTMCVVIADSLIKTIAKATKFDERKPSVLKPGRDFDVVMLSIHPKETHELARAKKVEIFNLMTPPAKGGGEDIEWRKTGEAGWHMLTGTQESIHAITNAVGFKYSYDAEKDLINHPSASMILTPEGQVSSYVIGPNFPTKVLETDLALARENKVGEKADQSFMFGCIRMDPNTGQYTVVVENVLRVVCVLTVLALLGSIAAMSLKERRKANLGGGGAVLR